jgi:anti-sigma factor RsiW
VTNDEPATGVTPERIVAYLDGELPPGERDAVARAIASDPAAARMAAEMQAAAVAAAAAFADMAGNRIPERLGRLLAEPEIVPFPPRRAAWRRAIAPAAAAAIGLLLLASIALVPRDRAPLRPASDGGSPAQDRFTAALYGALDRGHSGETVAYGQPTPQAGGQITLLGDLATRSGLACREFRAETHGGGSGMVQAGIACRRPDQGWDVLTEPRP